MSWLGDLLGLGTGAALTGTAYAQLGGIGEELQQGAQGVAQQGLEQSQFRPFSVTTATGNVQANQDGYTMNLSPEQQALQQQLGQGASGMFSSATGDQSQREQTVFDRIRAMQAPEEQRNRLALEERLQNQGRLGVRTSMFGGTPEQFSMDQAQAEAQNQAALMAMQQAQSQQAQDASIGGQMMQQQYLPQANMLQAMQPGLQLSQLQQRSQLQGSNLFGEASMAGLDAQLAAALGQTNLVGQLGTGLLAGSAQGAQSQDGLFDKILSLWG